VTQESIRLVKQLGADDGVPVLRKIWKAIREVFDALAGYMYAFIFLSGNPALKNAAQVAEATSDGADLVVSGSDYLKASERETTATGEAKKVYQHMKTYNLLRLIKTITGFATLILGSTILAIGASKASLIALAVLALTTTLLAVMRDRYKGMSAYKVPNFDRTSALVV
jgi:hypothetical protein